MDKNQKVKSSKSLAFKIIIPVLIIAAIGVMWFLKNPSGTTNATNNNSDFSLDATNDLDVEKLKTYGIPIIVDFGADTCIPCKEMAPVLKKLNTDMQDKAMIKFVDVGQNRYAAANFPLNVIPTQFFYNSDGTPFVPSDKLSKSIAFEMHKDLKTGQHNFTSHKGGLTEAQMLQILAEMGVK